MSIYMAVNVLHYIHRKEKVIPSYHLEDGGRYFQQLLLHSQLLIQEDLSQSVQYEDRQ